jgi:hypothetical protein
VVVDEAQQDGVAAAVRQARRLLVAAQDRDVHQAGGADRRADLLEPVVLDLGREHAAARTDRAAERHREVAVARADVRDALAGAQLERLDDAVGLGRLREEGKRQQDGGNGGRDTREAPPRGIALSSEDSASACVRGFRRSRARVRKNIRRNRVFPGISRPFRNGWKSGLVLYAHGVGLP